VPHVAGAMDGIAKQAAARGAARHGRIRASATSSR